ncbi:EGF-like domain-containing protein [Tieghemostelium lacteum]|uniref:EGF-like domain-containing protein n=1 Tax=Tieghemostelium lacteum TaxID=361077 RepID=A0A151ZIA8_TIELA|nr:EGF-like domain-containing protein [Tieghemostelium lacteum]|eukprot:KYQ93584.1 EGF-like domain-containing protein [Tieghemostelium lacteum]
MQTRYLFIFFIFFISANVQKTFAALDTEQYNAIVDLQSTLKQTWNLANICLGNTNFISCDNSGTIVKTLVFSNPSDNSVLNVPDQLLIKLLNLTQVTFSANITFNDIFWTNLQNFKQLTTLHIAKIINLPANTGLYFPISLNSVVIDIMQIPVPQTLLQFTRGSLILGTSNTGPGLMYPTQLSGPSLLTSLTTSSYGGGFQINGENFVQLNSLSLYIGDYQSLGYNMFDKFPQLIYLFIQASSNIIGTQVFPHSVFTSLKLNNFNCKAAGKYYMGTPTINFSNSPNITSVFIEDLDLTSAITYPGIQTYPNSEVLFTLQRCKVDLSKVDFSAASYFGLLDCNLIGNLPSNQDYSKLSKLDIVGNFSGTVPNEVCEVKSSLNLYNTLVSSLPECFVCEWGGYQCKMVNNTLMPYQSPSCNNISTVMSPSLVPTHGGELIITGYNMGWGVFGLDNIQLPSSKVYIGNEKLSFSAPTGTGKNKNVSYKLHGPTLPNLPSFLGTYSYMPPTILGIMATPENINIQGDNFTPLVNLINVTIAGIQVKPTTSNYIGIVIKNLPSIIPYYTDVIVSVKVVVDGQDTTKVIRPASGTVSASLEFPTLTSSGGYLRIIGQYLTFDTTLMSLTLNDVSLTLFKAESANSLVFSYGPIAASQTYILNYNQEGTLFSESVSVSSQPQCQVVQGYCVGNQSVCNSGYTGPDCSSLNIVTPKPTTNQSFPITSYQGLLQFNNQAIVIKYTVQPVSLRERNQAGQTIVDFPLSTFNLTSYPDADQYTMNFNNSTLVVIIHKYTSANSISYSGGSEFDVLPSTIRYQTGFSAYNFSSSTNTLEIAYQMVMESTETTGVCGAYDSNDMTDYFYGKSKINYIDFFTRVNKKCDQNQMSGNTIYSLSYPQVLPYKITSTLTFQAPAWFPWNVYSSDFDFNLLFDTVSASQGTTKMAPVCATTPSPSSNIPCQGNPVCGGPSQGICQTNGTCICINGYTGSICDSKPTKIPQTDPNPSNPNTDTETESGVGLHISILSIRELDFQGKQEREIPINGWTLKQVNSTEKITYLYSSTLFNGTCLLNVTIDYFNQDSVVSFAGQNSTKLAGSIKYSAQITKWPFLKQINQLEVVFSSSIKDTSESIDSCTHKTIEYDESNPLETQSNVRMVYIQVNDRTFSTTFNNLAVVDGIPRQIRNVLLPNQVNDSNTQSNSLIGVLTPHHNEYIIIDPDFNLLVSYVDPSDKEGSICSDSDKKKLTKAQLAGIIVASVVVGSILLLMAIYLIKRTTTSKILIGKMKSKMNRLK